MGTLDDLWVQVCFKCDVLFSMVDPITTDICGKGTVYLPRAYIHIHSQIHHPHKSD